MKPGNLLLSLGCCISLSAGAQKTFVDGTPLSVINAATRTVTASLGHAGNFDGLRLSPDGTKLLAYNESLNRIYTIDIASNAFVDSVSFTSFVYDFLPGPGNSLYYSGNPTSRIYKMDLATKTHIDSTTVFTAGSARFVPRPGSAEIWIQIEDKMYSFTGSSMTLTSISNGVPSSQYIAGDMVFDSSGSKVYYFSQPFGGDGILYRMDAISKTIEDSLITPNALGGLKTVFPATNGTLYMTYFGLWPNEPDKVYIGQDATMTLTDSVTLPHKPFYMAQRPATQELWISYHYDAMVGILDLSNNLAVLDSVTVGANPKRIVFTNAPNAVSQVAETEGAGILPNPGNGLFRIVTTRPVAGAIYSVTDMTGRKISAGRLAENQVADLTAIPNGLYLIQVSHRDGAYCFRVVKN